MAVATVAPTETEREQLRANCMQALKDERIIDVQFKALMKKIKALRNQGRALQEENKVKGAKTKTAFVEYAKASCRELSDQVYKAFPREIREIIYGYVADCPNIRIEKCDKYTKGINYFDAPSETWLRYPWGSKIDPWWERDFVGPEMVREVGETVYRTACFDFMGNFHLIAKFRVTDQWSLGFLPVSFVSNVEVCILCEDYQLGPCHGEIKSVEQYGRHQVPSEWGYDNPRKIPSDILVGLETLFGFKSGTAITIKMVLDSHGGYKPTEREEWMCENVVPFIFPTVERLKKAGYRVRFVIVGDPYSAPPTSFRSNWNPVSAKDVTNSFCKHVEVQQKALQQALDDAEPDEDFSYGGTISRDDDAAVWTFTGIPIYENSDPPNLGRTDADDVDEI